MTNEEIAVLNGVSLLNGKIPGWEKSIDWDVLDIYDLDSCVIGQLAGDSTRDIFDELGLQAGFSGSSTFGFDLAGGGSPQAYAPLNQAWKAWAKENVR